MQSSIFVGRSTEHEHFKLVYSQGISENWLSYLCLCANDSEGIDPKDFVPETHFEVLVSSMADH